MTAAKIWKRIRCPHCQALIIIRYATDRTWVVQDSKPSLYPPSEQENESALTETQEIAVKEIAKRIAQEKIDAHEDAYNHDSLEPKVSAEEIEKE